MRTKIMDGARTLFREKGYSNVTMRAIGRKVGCSAAAIYRHFKNKREIMDALRHEGFQKLLGLLRQEVASEDPRERLVELAGCYVRFARSHTEAFALMYNLAGQGPEQEGAVVEEPTETYEFFADEVRRSVEAGCFEQGVTAETVRYSLWSAMHGIACLINCGRLEAVSGEVDEKELVERVLRFVVR